MKVESLPSDEQQDFPISFHSNQPATLDILLLSNFPSCLSLRQDKDFNVCVLGVPTLP